MNRASSRLPALVAAGACVAALLAIPIAVRAAQPAPATTTAQPREAAPRSAPQSSDTESPAADGAAQPPKAESGSQTPRAAGGTDDPWGFEEEEQKVETWGDILRPQLLDVSLTIVFLAFAMVSFFKKSKALKYVTLVMSVAYLGVIKSQLVSITDLFRVADMSFPTMRDGVNWYLFTGFTVVSTVLWGRVYCGRICAFGAFTQLMDATLPARLRVEPPKWLERRASWIKYGLLVATVAYYMTTKHFAVYRYVEPFWMYTRTADAVLWSMLGLLLVATIFVRNAYCRFLCPVGATLGIISTLTVFKIKRWSECKSCTICEKTCEWGAIQGPKIIKTECVRCDDCERVYADEKACPHWLIPVIRSRKIAEAMAAGRPAPRFIAGS